MNHFENTITRLQKKNPHAIPFFAENAIAEVTKHVFAYFEGFDANDLPNLEPEFPYNWDNYSRVLRKIQFAQNDIGDTARLAKENLLDAVKYMREQNFPMVGRMLDGVLFLAESNAEYVARERGFKTAEFLKQFFGVD